MGEGHPDRGRLLAYLDCELGADDREVLGRHLDGCARCRRRLEQIESRENLFSHAAGRLDRPMPEIPNPTAAGGGSGGSGGSGSAGGSSGVSGGADDAGLRSSGMPSLRAAAVVLLLLVGGALLTPPGRALAERALGGIAGLFRGEPASPVATAVRDTAAPADARRSPQSTAVSVTASGGRLRVLIQTADSAAGVLRVGPRARDRALVEGVLGNVERGPGQLRVRVEALDSIRVRLPDSVGAAEVLVDGRPVLRQSGRSVTPAVPADTVDGDILLRVGP